MAESGGQVLASQGHGHAQDELLLLEKVLLRVASADSDAALSTELAKFLTPVLLKLTSGHEGVRKKVMELLVHVNKRAKSNANVQLPVDSLLLQYQEPEATSFVTNFTVIYIKMGYPRLSLEKKTQLIPSVLNSLDGKPSSHQDSLFHMIIPYLTDMKCEESKKRSHLTLDEKPQVLKVFLAFLLDYLLLPYGSHPSLQQAAPPGDPAADDATSKVPPCLSEASWKRVAGEVPIKAEELERHKVIIVKFLGMGFIDEMEVLTHLIIGAADTRHSVVSQAEAELRRLASAFDLDDPGLATKIYALFLGTLTPKDRPAVKADQKRLPANTRIRLKLLTHLLKCRQAATQFPASVQVTFDVLFGNAANSNAKLKMMAVSFIHQIIAECPTPRLSAIGPMLLSALGRVIAENASPAAAKLRSACYTAIAKLGLKVPDLVNKDATMLQMFFEAMTKEDKETQLSVHEAMALMAPSFKQMESSNLKFLEAMLATYVEKDEPQVRLVAVQYAGEVFPSDHVASRFILLVGAGDSKDDIAKAAKAHLYGAVNRYCLSLEQGSKLRDTYSKGELKRESILPDFSKMLSFVLEKAAIREKTQQRHVVGSRVLAFVPQVCIQILSFLHMCLVNSAGVLPSHDAIANPRFGAPAVAKFLAAQKDDKRWASLQKMMSFTENVLSVSQDIASARCLLHVIGTTAQLTASSYWQKLAWIRGLLDSTREDYREAIAEIHGLVASEMEAADFERAVSDLCKGFKEKTAEVQHGVVLAVGFTFGRRLLAAKTGGRPHALPGFDASTALVLSQLSALQSIVVSGACLAVAELGRCGPLPLKEQAETDTTDKADATIVSKVGLIKKLLTIMRSSKMAMKVRERAALALGQICVGDDGFSHRRLVVDEFLASLQEVKDVELHLSMGEGVALAAIGAASPVAKDPWTTEEDESAHDHGNQEHALYLINRLCKENVLSTHPNIRQGTCLWLLALTKQGMRMTAIKKNLLVIQSAFMAFLGDNNDLVQDAASKGLGMVYDACDEAQQNTMLANLLDTLSEGKRETQKVSDDTKVFEEWQMGKAPTGGNLSTYKELCSLATDLNQPDLVYKFMNLASHNATWNSKKGAAFGFSTIAARAGEQLEPLLPKIIPKLYRYTWDPSPKIQDSMTSIWNTLVPESAKTVDKYLADIVRELHVNLTSNQWRVRESCCLALQDLLRGRTLDDVIEVVPDLWVDVFRVMDDVKESCRLAATKTAESLSRICIRMCDMTQGAKSGEKAVKAILPPLLEKGLVSGVPEVRSVTISTIIKITKNAGSYLKPHLAVLIPALLEATSELEGKDINYLSVRLANDAAVQERLDMARIAAAKSSPLMDCVNSVLAFVDSDTLTALTPRLMELIKGNVGVGTKGTTAHVIVLLVQQCPLDLQPLTGKILAAFVSGLSSDRNAAVRKTYAMAIGHLLRAAKDSSVEKLFIKLRTWYMERDDEATKWAIAYTLQAVSRQNSERMKSHAIQVLPMAFLAMHDEKRSADEEESLLDVWEEVWSECVPGTEGGIRQYLREIMALLSVAIEAPQWRLKAQAARAMGTVAVKLANELPQEETKQLLTLLLNALAGRTWDGKEAVVRAMSDVCGSSPRPVLAVLADPAVAIDKELVTTCLIRECGKEKLAYKVVALEAIGVVCQAVQLECFDKIYQLAHPVIKVEEAEKNEEDRDEKKESEDLLIAMYRCLGSAWPQDPAEQAKYVVSLLEVLCARVEMSTRKSQMAITQCLRELVKKMVWPLHDDSALTKDVAVGVAKLLTSVIAIPKSSQLREEAISVLEMSVERLGQVGDPVLAFAFQTELAKAVEEAIKDVSSAPAAKARTRDVKGKLAAIVGNYAPEDQCLNEEST